MSRQVTGPEELMNTIRGIALPKGYTMFAHEAEIIRDTAKGDAHYCIAYAFRYGFLKGQRAERNARKEEGHGEAPSGGGQGGNIVKTTAERILEILGRLQPEYMTMALEYARNLAQTQEVTPV